MVHCKELICLLLLVPNTRIDDDLLAVINIDLIRYAYFLCIIDVEVVIAEHRSLNKIHPGRRAVSGRSVEAARCIARKVQGIVSDREMPFAAVRPGSRFRSDEGLSVWVRRVCEPDLVAVDRQILLRAVNSCRDVILITLNRLKCPFCDIRVLRHQKDSVVVQYVRLHDCGETSQPVLAAHFLSLCHQGS